LNHALSLSAYDDFDFSYVGQEGYTKLIDFVFYEKHLLKLAKIFEQPSKEKINENTPLPNECTPSDHLPIIFEFCLTEHNL